LAGGSYHDGGDAHMAPLALLEAPLRSLLPTPVLGSRVKTQIFGFGGGGTVGVATLVRASSGSLGYG
jgi:hypothetical protein